MHLTHLRLLTCCLAFARVAPTLPAAEAPDRVHQGQMAGYLLVPNEKVSET